MSKNVCNLFIKVDKLFINGNVIENAFNSSPYTNFCPEGGCNNNYDRIGALCDYLLVELPKNNDKQDGDNNVNQNYEYIIMWLASKFLKITLDHSYTLNEYYDDFLVNHKDKFNYWNKLDNIKYLKDSNVTVMTSLYNLLMNICKALTENEISNFDLKKFKKNDLEFYKNYKLINDEKNKCDPYIQLFTDLKKTYDEYRNLAINEISKKKYDNKTFLEFSPITNNDNQKELLFQSYGCKQLHAFFQGFSNRPKPKSPSSEPQPPPNSLQDKKDDGKKDKEPQKDANQPTKKEIQPSNIGEEFNFEKIRDYSLQIFDNYSPLFNHAATRIGYNIRYMVTHNFNDMVGIGAKYLKAIEKVNFPKFQFQVANNHQKESEKLKKEKVEPSTSPQTTGGTTLSSNDIPSKVVDVLGNNLVRLNKNITRLVSFKFEGNKAAIIALTVVSITIVLAIMYWYLYYGCGKPMKKKKMVNKIINLVDEKRSAQRAISSTDRKRTVKTNIDSDYGEKTTIVIINPYDEKNITIQSVNSPSLKITLLNTHKHIYVNPSPFINLFFLLIFFVYKRGYNSLQ
ncbi:PIR protein CIR protein [Plasmodium vinckei lentum]|uniref:PIR protein CIR protein n=1 Tax=Plasmodium vinckei lentum TaxID=138297 RepID=A0A6V7S7H3_PLAVN|nr:PIR protein CIR protein [Plasmodium vinckei lentum]